MNWNLLEFFEDEQVSATPISIVSTTGSSGFPEIVEKEHDSVKGLMYTRSAASRAFNITFQEDISNAFITGDVTNISNTGKLSFDEIEYEIDSVEDVASQGSIWVVGLKGRK